MTKSKSSSRWLKRQSNDPFVARAQADGWRSRAVYKLEELDRRYELVANSQVIVDLGAAPGAWTQYVLSKQSSQKKLIISLDILDMEEIDGARLIQGDFTEDEPLQELVQMLDGAKVDLVLSDMAPNISGNRVVDQPKAMYLAELALDFARNHLCLGGGFAVKLFQGEGYSQYISELKTSFGQVNSVKPQASRKESREMFAVARQYRV